MAETGEEARNAPAWVHAVTPAEILRQRSLQWPDFHPEDFCHQCGRRNPCWFADTEVWQTATGSTGDGGGVLCPSCFAELWETKTGKTAILWRLSIDPRSRDYAVPDPRFRDQLKKALIAAESNGTLIWGTVEVVDALMPTIAAEVKARVQAAANQRAVEYERGRMGGAAETFRSLASNLRFRPGHVPTADDFDRLAREYAARAAALASPAPAPRAEEGQADVMPEGWIDADWTHYS